MKTPIYLDHAATTPLDPAVREAMLPYLGDAFANPSSVYSAARNSRLAVEHARSQVAAVLGCKVTEIIFTSGGTEGDNLAVQGVLRAAGPGSHWVTSAIEHDAVLSMTGPMEGQGFPCDVAPVDISGIIRPSDIMDRVRDETVLISVMAANNEIGTIQPLQEIAKCVATLRSDRLRRGIDRPLYVHTDACQSPLFLSLHADRLGVDLITLSGSKMYGPKGTGVLYIRHGVALEPLMYGGGQERGRRSGTENVPGIVGFAAALTQAAESRESDNRRLRELRDRLIQGVMAAVPTAVLNGDRRRRLPNNVHFTIPGCEGESMVLYLDNAGFMASTGSACSSGSLEPSHVLLAIGCTPDAAQNSLRLTIGRSTDESAIDAFLEAFPPIVERLHAILD